MTTTIYSPSAPAVRELMEFVASRHDYQLALSRGGHGGARHTQGSDLVLVWLDADIPAAVIDEDLQTVEPEIAEAQVLRWNSTLFETRSNRGAVKVANLCPYERWCNQAVWAHIDFQSRLLVLAPDVITPLDATASGAIGGKTGSTVGAGNATVQRVVDGEIETWLDCDDEARLVPVNNSLTSGITDGQQIKIVRQAPSYEFFVIAADCVVPS